VRRAIRWAALAAIHTCRSSRDLARALLVLHALSVGNIVDVGAAHIHCAPEGVNGPVGITLFVGVGGLVGSGNLANGPLPDPDPGNGCGWVTLDDAIAAMEAGNAYVNVHTVANPAGRSAVSFVSTAFTRFRRPATSRRLALDQHFHRSGLRDLDFRFPKPPFFRLARALEERKTGPVFSELTPPTQERGRGELGLHGNGQSRRAKRHTTAYALPDVWNENGSFRARSAGGIALRLA